MDAGKPLPSVVAGGTLIYPRLVFRVASQPVATFVVRDQASVQERFQGLR
jgi:hypothetical protein